MLLTILESSAKKLQIRTLIYEESIKDLQNRGQQLLKDRSILYKTPKESSKLLPLPTPNRMSAMKYSESKLIFPSMCRTDNIVF